MKQPSLFQISNSLQILLSIIFLAIIPQTVSVLQCSLYEISFSTQYIDYDPSNPSSTTVSCSISLSNSQSIGAAAELIDSFDLLFENFESGHSLPIDGTVLDIGTIISVTELVSLTVKRVRLDSWEIYVQSVYPQSSGQYTCNIGGCNSSSSLYIQYIPSILESPFSLVLPSNSIEVYIKCPIEKTQYFLRICNSNVTNCVSTRVSYETPDSELFLSPPLTTDNLVEHTQENMQCLIISVSGSFFRESDYIISTTQQPLRYENISKLVGEALTLTVYCQAFLDSINVPMVLPQPSYSNSILQTIPSTFDSLITADTGLYYCNVQHKYFKASLLILNLTVNPTTPPPVSVNSTTPPPPLSLTTATTNTPTAPTTIPHILQFPHYLYYLVLPGSGAVILLLGLGLSICCCVVFCFCCRKYCSGRSRKFSIHEISPPMPPRRDASLSPPYVPLPELMEIALPLHRDYTFQSINLGAPFEGGLEESILNEIPMLRPHRNQTLFTKEQAYAQVKPKKGLYRERSVSMPDFEKTPERVTKLGSKHSSTHSPFDISSTQPPSQSVSVNKIPEPHNDANQLLKPRPLHLRQRSRSAETTQISYGILPLPQAPGHPLSHLRAHTVAYVPVPSTYMSNSPVTLVQPQNLSPISQPYRTSFNLLPPSPVAYPARIERQATPPPTTLNQQHSIPTPASDTPATPTHPKGTTININIISKESLEVLPPGHFVDFL